MAKKTTKKSNPKNDAKMKAFAILVDSLVRENFTVFDNDDFTAKLTSSTFVVDVDGVDVKVVLSVPNGDVENTRYEREDGVEIETELKEDLDEEETEKVSIEE